MVGSATDDIKSSRNRATDRHMGDKLMKAAKDEALTNSLKESKNDARCPKRYTHVRGHSTLPHSTIPCSYWASNPCVAFFYAQSSRVEASGGCRMPWPRSRECTEHGMCSCDPFHSMQFTLTCSCLSIEAEAKFTFLLLHTRATASFMIDLVSAFHHGPVPVQFHMYSYAI